jgi:excisionase family DNA binding protein
VGTTDDDQPLFTIQEACEYLQVSQPTVYRLIKRGVLTKVKLSRIRGARITLSSLDEYKAGQKLSVDELAVRVLDLERKVEVLMQQLASQGRPPSTKRPTMDLLGARRTLQRLHPEVFSR